MPSSKVDQEFLAAALEEAHLAADHDDVPVGAVVVKDGRIIGRGHNRREADRDPSAHAEIVAIREAARTVGHWNLTGCTLYVTLEPCPMCAGAAVLSRLKEMVYGATDPKGGALSLGIPLLDHPKLNHRVKTRLVPLEEGAALLRDFFRKKRAR
ncbi:MAG: nucleoside deaminase [Bdellovibrionales bacterium]|nr:nucleoside deaminase [Bdellovibrionales bacterium]